MIAACGHGIRNIVCEKPFVLSRDEYRAVARARASSGSRIISVDNWRHSDLNKHVSRLLAEGTIGEVREVVLRTGRPDHAKGNLGWMPHWRTDRAMSGGGILLDHGWHQLYLVLGWVGGQIECVRSITRTVDPRHAPVEDEASLELSFPKARARIELSWAAGERRNDGWVRGTLGEMAIYDDRIVVHNGDIERVVPFTDRLTRSSYHPEWFRAVLQAGILDRSGGEAIRNFAEAGLLIAVISAAYRSAGAGGEPVQLERTNEAGEEKKRKDVYCSSVHPAT
jgi:predicted dehydrogenase